MAKTKLPTKKELMSPNLDKKGFSDKQILDGLLKFKLIDPMKGLVKKAPNPKAKDTKKMLANKGGMAKKKTKYMAMGGMAKKKTKYMAKGGAVKKTKYMAKGGAMKKTKYMAKGGATRR